MTDGNTEASRVRCEVCCHSAAAGDCVRALVDGREFFAHDRCAVYAFRQASFDTRLGAVAMPKVADLATAFGVAALSPESRALVEALIKALS